MRSRVRASSFPPLKRESVRALFLMAEMIVVRIALFASCASEPSAKPVCLWHQATKGKQRRHVDGERARHEPRRSRYLRHLRVSFLLNDSALLACLGFALRSESFAFEPLVQVGSISSLSGLTSCRPSANPLVVPAIYEK